MRWRRACASPSPASRWARVSMSSPRHALTSALASRVRAALTATVSRTRTRRRKGRSSIEPMDSTRRSERRSARAARRARPRATGMACCAVARSIVPASLDAPCAASLRGSGRRARSFSARSSKSAGARAARHWRSRAERAVPVSSSAPRPRRSRRSAWATASPTAGKPPPSPPRRGPASSRSRRAFRSASRRSSRGAVGSATAPRRFRKGSMLIGSRVSVGGWGQLARGQRLLLGHLERRAGSSRLAVVGGGCRPRARPRARRPW
jgi:hypothetical protein